MPKKAEKAAPGRGRPTDLPAQEGLIVATPETEADLVPPSGHRLRETGNGATVSYEEALLREIYGEPDENGVYR
ncbi:hypothetical protein [Streptomyces sp. NPDC057854]|uniref:hypothetical protein n=1 Tax=unclassified Streptomyces TaxID=2593676 RepID=UPI0036B353EC